MRETPLRYASLRLSH